MAVVRGQAQSRAQVWQGFFRQACPRLCQLRRLNKIARTRPVVGGQRQTVGQKAEQGRPVAADLVGASQRLDRSLPAGNIVEQSRQAVARTG